MYPSTLAVKNNTQHISKGNPVIYILGVDIFKGKVVEGVKFLRVRSHPDLNSGLPLISHMYKPFNLCGHEFCKLSLAVNW